jgi:hypothetical protein
MIQSIKEKEGLSMDEINIETAAFVKIGTTLDNLGYAVN